MGLPKYQTPPDAECMQCYGSGKAHYPRFRADGPCQWCRTSAFMDWRKQFIPQQTRLQLKTEMQVRGLSLNPGR